MNVPTLRRRKPRCEAPGCSAGGGGAGKPTGPVLLTMVHPRVHSREGPWVSPGPGSAGLGLMRRRDQTFLQCLPDSRAWRRLSSYISSHQTVGPGPLPSGLLGTYPVPTLPPPHCCLDMVGGPPAHFHARLFLPSAWPWRVVQGEEEPRRVPALICAHHRGPRRWLPGTPHMAFPEPGGLCPVLLGPPGTGTSSDPAPRPCSGMRPGCGVTGRPVSAPGLRALRRKGAGLH